MRRGADERAIPRTLAALTIGAILLRLLMFLGRGDYIAFDEGWYLLLGQSLWSGEGYRLTGLRHTTLSPLFPFLAGGLARVSGDLVWAGRIVAAVTSGLLVVPCWFIFRRIAGRRTALLGCVVVAVMPSLAPFVTPDWVGWDLWVGAEPLYLLFLYTGIALLLYARGERSMPIWLGAGASLSLAYLARPEAVVVTGLLGLATAAVALMERRPRVLLGCVLAGVAFTAASLPYWVYLRNTTGRWTLTGRAVQVRVADRKGPSASSVIEGMLWQGRQGAYVRRLFSLDPTGTRMASTYWGIPEPGSEPRVRSVVGVPENSSAVPDARDSIVGAGTAVDSVSATKAAGDSAVRAPQGPTAMNRAWLYLRAFGRLAPVAAWLLFVVGVLGPRRAFRQDEALVSAPLALTSLLVAWVIAVDPRTQLFLVPMVCLYAARGARLVGARCESFANGSAVRRGVVQALIAVLFVGSLVVEDGRRLYMSLAKDTPVKRLASEHRIAGEVIRGIVPEGKKIMSWHPAIAIHAGREWRVLPMASLSEILRYAEVIGADYVVLSDYHPSPIPPAGAPGAYLVLPVVPGAAKANRLAITVTDVRQNVAVGDLIPIST